VQGKPETGTGGCCRTSPHSCSAVSPSSMLNWYARLWQQQAAPVHSKSVTGQRACCSTKLVQQSQHKPVCRVLVAAGHSSAEKA
jgi:hypothetical protein